MSTEQQRQPNSKDSAASASTCDWKPGQANVCGDTLWQPPQMNAKFALTVAILVAALTAAAPFQNVGSLIIWWLIGLTWLFGCPRTKRATLWVTAALFVPFLWMLWPVDASDRTTWTLPAQFGQAWGLIPTRWLLADGVSAIARSTTSAAITGLTFLGAVTIIRFWPHTHWWIWGSLVAVAFAWSWILAR